jgi:hypothetical protein
LRGDRRRVDEAAPESLDGRVGAAEHLMRADLDHSDAAGMALRLLDE